VVVRGDRIGDPSKRTAVTFDLWNTLIFEFGNQENSAKRRALRTEISIDVLAGLGETVDPDLFHTTFVEVSDEMTRGHEDGLDSHFGEWIHLGLSRIDAGLPDRIGLVGVSEVGAAIDKAFLDTPPTLLEGSLELLDQLVRHGILLGLITNTGLTSGSAFRQWFTDIGIHNKFGHIAYSNEMALAKPDRQMFDATLRALGTEHGRGLHVGDNLNTDVAGSAATGMSTVWVAGDKERKSALASVAVQPDFTVGTILELPAIVDSWVESLQK
jgi:FMN phosphatase YigB (HAD superfamily)